uniref:glycogenin glucosyltransferase n=1 Tax=Panagrolaimus superbus TaxID=310955 RepID=A0A914YXH1_9BILA
MPSAWVTLATNDGYALGALVLAHSLRRAKSKHHSHILYTDGVSAQMRSRLLAVFHDSTRVDVLDSNDTENLALIGRPDLGITFTKLHCWRLTQYEKCVFLDADTLIIQNCDELFERPEFAAAPDIGWPDLFNSGVFVFVPSNETYQKLVEFGTQHGTFDGGDQGLLNLYFSNWREMDASHRLPFIYNVTSGSIYSYKAAYQLFGGKVKIVHFLGTVKPWHRGSSEKHGHQTDHWGYWQQIFNEDVVINLPKGLNPSYIGPLEAVIVLDPRRQSSEVRYSPSKTPAYVEIKSNPISNVFYGGGNENASSIFMHLQQTSSSSLSHQSEATGLVQNPLEAQQSESTYKEGGASGKSDEERYTAWDQGAPDYQGRDAFSFIKKQIESVLHEALPEAAADPLRPESPLPSPDPEIKDVVTENIVPEVSSPHESAESSEQQPHSEEHQQQPQE